MSTPKLTPDQAAIAAECDEIKEMLLEKNRLYGSSVLSPLHVFSRSGSEERIRSRLDDKVSRLARGDPADEDTIKDLIGYLVLLRVAQKRGAA